MQDEGDAPGSSIVVEALGDRLMAALLEREGWSLVVATRRHADSFEGTWLRFHGGQALGGQYRAPAAPRELGPATLKWADGDCLVSRLPDGRQRLFARGPAGTAQNLRSTEKLAS